MLKSIVIVLLAISTSVYAQVKLDYVYPSQSLVISDSTIQELKLAIIEECLNEDLYSGTALLTVVVSANETELTSGVNIVLGALGYDTTLDGLMSARREMIREYITDIMIAEGMLFNLSCTAYHSETDGDSSCNIQLSIQPSEVVPAVKANYTRIDPILTTAFKECKETYGTDSITFLQFNDFLAVMHPEVQDPITRINNRSAQEWISLSKSYKRAAAYIGFASIVITGIGMSINPIYHFGPTNTVPNPSSLNRKAERKQNLKILCLGLGGLCFGTSITLFHCSYKYRTNALKLKIYEDELGLVYTF